MISYEKATPRAERALFGNTDITTYTVSHIARCLDRFVKEIFSQEVCFNYDRNMVGSITVNANGLAHLIKTMFTLHGGTRYLYVKMFSAAMTVHLQFSRAEGFENPDELDIIEDACREAKLHMRLFGDTLDFYADLKCMHVIPVYEVTNEAFYRKLVFYFNHSKN